MYFYMLITFLKQNKIFPNEEMMLVLSKFFGKLIFQERKSIHKKEEKEIDNDTDFTINRNETLKMEKSFIGEIINFYIIKND